MHYIAIAFAALSLAISLALPASAQQTPPDDFGTLPAIYDAALSPDGSQVAVFVNVSGRYGIRIMSVTGDDANKGQRVSLLGQSAKPSWIKWANNDQVLASLWSSEVIRRTPVTVSYLYSVKVDTMEGDFLIKPPTNYIRQNNSTVVDFLEDDPDHILMSYATSPQGKPSIMRVNVRTGYEERLKPGSGNVQMWYTDQRGEPRIGQGLDRRYTEKEVWNLTIRDADGNKWRDESEYPGLEADTDIVAFTGNPNELIIRTRNGRDTLGLYIYNLSTKTLGGALFHDDTYDASGIILSADGNDILGASLVADSREIKMFEEKTTVLGRMSKKFHPAIVDYIDQSFDKDRVLFKVSGPYYPGTLMMVDINNDDVVSLGHYYPQLKENELGSVQSIKYPARDGFKVPAYITLPRKVELSGNIDKIPFIILPHGGPYARSSKRFDYFAQFFASQGYGVVQMNFRGSAGYGEAYENAGRESWVLMQEDVEDGARWLIEKGYADPDRLCIAGWSFGGYVSLMGAVNHPDLYKCAISMAGVTDIPDLIRDAKQYQFGKITAMNSITSGFEDGKEMRENSPARRANEITMPVFIAHGTSDQRVHFDQYERMVRALRKGPAKVTAMEFEGEDHFLSDEVNRKRFFNGVAQFLTEVNGKSEWAND